jgi:hypothetical protein
LLLSRAKMMRSSWCLGTTGFSSPCCSWRNRFGEEITEVWIWCRSSRGV